MEGTIRHKLKGRDFLLNENEIRQKVVATAKKYIDCKEQQGNNTTYSNATSSAAGLMSVADKEKLDGINTPDPNTLYLISEEAEE